MFHRAQESAFSELCAMKTRVRSSNLLPRGVWRDVVSVSSTCGLVFRTFCTSSQKFAQGKNTHAESPPSYCLLIHQVTSQDSPRECTTMTCGSQNPTLLAHTSRDESGLAAGVHNHVLRESKSFIPRVGCSRRVATRRAVFDITSWSHEEPVYECGDILCVHERHARRRRSRSHVLKREYEDHAQRSIGFSPDSGQWHWSQVSGLRSLVSGLRLAQDGRKELIDCPDFDESWVRRVTVPIANMIGPIRRMLNCQTRALVNSCRAEAVADCWSKTWSLRLPLARSPRTTPHVRTLSIFILIAVYQLFSPIWSNTTLSKRAGAVVSTSVAEFCVDSLLKKYQGWHQRQLLRLSEGCSEIEEVKFIVYTCHRGQLCGGLGDRLSGIISTFFLAIALDRLLLIDYSEPRSLSETLTPNAIQWNIDTINKSCFERLQSDPRFTTTIEGIDVEATDLLLKKSAEVHATGVPIIRMKMNRYHVALSLWQNHTIAALPYVGLLYENARCSAPHICAMTTFKHAFSVLFRVSGRVEDRVNQMVDSLGLRDDSTDEILPFIGVHARVGGGTWKDPSRHRVDQAEDFLRCAHSKEAFVLAAMRDEQSAGIVKIPIVVVSDSDEFKLAVRALDSNIRLFNNSLIHIDKVHFSDSNTVEQGNIDSFADITLLSRALCIVASSSTFSGVAGALQERPKCFARFFSCEDDHFDFFYEDEKFKLKVFGEYAA